MISFQDIQIKYGDYVAIDRLNLHIEPGEFFTFLGPSGCGKTTTLRALAGFITPSEGSIFVNDNEITHLPIEKRKVGIVFQSYALFPTMNVYENIAFGLKLQKKTREEIDRKIKEVARKIDLNESHFTRNVAELSGGQQQRVALARAIVLEPDILCLDEPLSNLDAKMRVGLRSELKRLQRELGITTLYVTHDQEEALTLSDRIAVFNKGKIEQIGTPYEIYNQSATEFVCDFIGDMNRLDKHILQEVNKQTGNSLDISREGYIRIERVSLQKAPDANVALSGKIIDREYHGMYIKYTFDVNGSHIKCIEKNDGYVFFEVGEAHNLHLNSRDIMQF
ncbi:ABC transporter ATP-binding protein [Paenibacillus rhizophilus]|uniref:ABC transporter ATP-binding protein n=1 Tax=Paenibacillus rhizophilus TaxID=1850366 RepID=A0A3N9P5Z8_9BACL|nr:ABC transporter ATP-binding protein [Paenibacillus rhizophilus]RQW11199.1 ABC transporter ATP-binding protein [Paenibacillus rhizophilus]